MGSKMTRGEWESCNPDPDTLYVFTDDTVFAQKIAGDDDLIDHQKLIQRYLVHYDSKLGPRFSVSVWSSQRQAEQDADGYRADGYPARVMKVSVVDGVPVAEWV